jgi:hypothetical protein
VEIVTQMLAIAFLASAAAVHLHAVVAIWKDVTRRDLGRAPQRAKNSAYLAGGFFVLWALVSVARISAAESAAYPGATASQADWARWTARLSAESVYTMGFLIATTALPAAAAWWLRRRRDAQ